jgi:2-dehydro-3-deoxygluconokinase
VSRFDVVSLGEPLYELNRQPDGNWLTGFGGDTLNVAIAAARLGSSTAYVTRLGDDIFAAELRDLMQREAIDMTALRVDQGAPTGLYFVTHGPSGHVFTYRRTGSAASRMLPADLDPALIASARFLHASGISQAISETAAETVAAAISMARKAGVGVSFDTNFRSRLWTAEKARPVIEAAAAQADILKTSDEDAAALFDLTAPPDVARHLLGLGDGVAQFGNVAGPSVLFEKLDGSGINGLGLVVVALGEFFEEMLDERLHIFAAVPQWWDL